MITAIIIVALVPMAIIITMATILSPRPEK